MVCFYDPNLFRVAAKQIKKKLQSLLADHFYWNNCSLYLSLDDVVYVAQHDFKATNDSDLPFKKGDKLKVLQE